MEQIGPVLHKIQKSARSQPKLVYVDKLKAFKGEPPKDWNVVAKDDDGGLKILETEENDGPLTSSMRPQREIRRPVKYGFDD